MVLTIYSPQTSKSNVIEWFTQDPEVFLAQVVMDGQTYLLHPEPTQDMIEVARWENASQQVDAWLVQATAALVSVKKWLLRLEAAEGQDVFETPYRQDCPTEAAVAFYRIG